MRGSGSRTAAGRRRTAATCRVCGAALVTGAEAARGHCRTCPSAYDEALLERLKAWRTDEAARRSVPAYVVLTDATLETIATDLPADRRALLSVPGIGARKIEAYAEPLLALVRGETPAHPGRRARLIVPARAPRRAASHVHRRISSRENRWNCCDSGRAGRSLRNLSEIDPKSSLHVLGSTA